MSVGFLLIATQNWVLVINVNGISVYVTNLEHAGHLTAVEVPLAFFIHGIVHYILLSQSNLKLPENILQSY